MEPPGDQNFDLEITEGLPAAAAAYRRGFKAKVDSSLHPVFWEDPAKSSVMGAEVGGVKQSQHCYPSKNSNVYDLMLAC